MTSLDRDDLRRVGSLFADQPERILAVADGLREGGRTVESRVRGTSMGDTLPDGAEIRIALQKQPTWRRGAVIAFLLGRRVTVHRVLARAGWPRRRFLITGGDARAFPDPPVAIEQVLGVVTEVCIGGSWRSLPRARRQWLVACVRAAMTALLLLASLGGFRVATAVAHGMYRLSGGGR